MMTIMVPAGINVGDMIQFTASDGEQMTVAADVGGGQQMTVNYTPR